MMTPPARLIRLHLRSRQAAATASVTAASTRTPFSEGARTASASLPLLRLTHMTALLTAAAALFATALTTGTHTIGASTMLRNLAGIGGSRFSQQFCSAPTCVGRSPSPMSWSAVTPSTRRAPHYGPCPTFPQVTTPRSSSPLHSWSPAWWPSPSSAHKATTPTGPESWSFASIARRAPSIHLGCCGADRLRMS